MCSRSILYSIGHFIVQHDTITKIPFDNMRRQGQRGRYPADFFDMRSGTERDRERRGHAGNPAAWRDVVAIVQFDAGVLARIELHPLTSASMRPGRAGVGRSWPQGHRGRGT